MISDGPDDNRRSLRVFDAVRHGLLRGLERAGDISRPAVITHVRHMRWRHPDATPAEIVRALERDFTLTVAGTGAAAGGVAAAPGVGLPAGVALAVADAGGFTAVSALFVFAVSEVYGIPTEDVVRRRTLLLGVLLGNSAQATLSRVAERTGGHWARKVVESVPVKSLQAINRVLGRNFVTKYGTKQGILVLGKVVPFGIGAAIGGVGNATLPNSWSSPRVVRSAPSRRIPNRSTGAGRCC